MTATANEVGNLTITDHVRNMVGRIVVATVQREGVARSVWFYVVAALPGMNVFGVNVGTNSSFYAPLDEDGFRLETATVDTYTTVTGLDRLSGDVRERLATFLRDSGLSVQTSPETPAEPTSEALAAAKAEGRAEATAEFDRWKEFATETAHEYANDNDLCGEFDRCMTEIGLRPRQREFYVEAHVTVSYNVGRYIEALSEEDAADQLAENIREYVSDEDVVTYGTWDVEL